MQPFRELNWWKWMYVFMLLDLPNDTNVIFYRYRVSPYTYLLEGFAGQGMSSECIY